MSEKITILMPCYNAEPFLKKTIESLCAQSYKNFILLVVDDASTDNSLSILEDFENGDARVKLLKGSANKGIIYRRNQLLSLCETEFACWADADDWYFPNRLEKQVEYLLSASDIGVCSCNFYKLKDGEEKLQTIEDYKLSKPYLTFFNSVFNPGAMFRMSIVRKHHITFDENVAGASDYHFWCNLSRFCRFGQVNEALVLYNVHSGQESTAQRQRQLQGHCEAVVENLRHYGLEVSIDQISQLLVFPLENLGQHLTREQHSSALRLIELIKEKLDFADTPIWKRTFVQLTIPHCRRLGLNGIRPYFSICGVKSLKYLNSCGVELLVKMFKVSIGKA